MVALTAVTSGAAAWSLRPPPYQPFTTVVFGPGRGALLVGGAAAPAGCLGWSRV